MQKRIPWVEKHRPASLEKFVFQNDDQKKKLTNIVESDDIPHLLFHGVQGSGKTTLSRIIVNTLVDKGIVDEMDVHVINGSDENSVDTIREKIKTIANTYSMGKYKIIQFEEMDYLSHSAQACLRAMMEDNIDNCRIIGTCNYPNKLMPALISRFQDFAFKSPSLDEVYKFTAGVLITEGIDFDPEVFKNYVDAYYPDIRKILNQMNSASIGGTLESPSQNAADSNDWRYKVIELIKNLEFDKMRQTVLSVIPREEYSEVFRVIYNNIESALKEHNKANAVGPAYILIANYLYKNSIVADPEINLAALFVELGGL